MAITDLRIAYSAATAGAVTLSVGGVATRPVRRESLVEAILRADKVLYEAKCCGKNKVVVHEWNPLPDTAG
jgi:PleD family two-component response regulator